MNVTMRAPREPLTISLRTLYNLERDPFYLTNKEALRILLEIQDHDTRNGTWFDELWGEREADESRLTHEVKAGDTVLRYIRTAAARITRLKRYRGTVLQGRELKHTAEMLIEFIIEADGSITLRRFQNSLSGKLKWSEHRPEKALWREIREELGIGISLRALRRDLRLVSERVKYLKDLRSIRETEIDVHPSSKYPGVQTHNQIFHFIWVMPERYWRNAYFESLRGGRTLVHIWAPTEAQYDRDWLLAHINRYMQALILRLPLSSLY